MTKTEVLVQGPHGITELILDVTKQEYYFLGDNPDRKAMIMIAMGVLEDLTEEEREEFGLEGVWL